jgi:hypothetical protein
MATAWKYTRQNMYACTHIVRQRLLLTTGGCKLLGPQWIRDASYFPRTVSHGGKLVHKACSSSREWHRSAVQASNLRRRVGPVQIQRVPETADARAAEASKRAHLAAVGRFHRPQLRLIPIDPGHALLGHFGDLCS